ncbi:MAG TPA: hypothetical protein VFY16_00565 [Gemmatimonadaceae bacterium]|nr:hypothetical protein [Gemmatimonadaceae bacterium]
MATPQILAHDPSSRMSGRPTLATIAGGDGATGAWTLLGAVGVAFTVVGFTDVALAWYPMAVGNPEWEFGTVSATLNGMPVPALGLTLMAASALQAGRRWQALLAGVVAVVLALVLTGCALLFALNIPAALNAVQQPFIRVGLLKGMAKAGVASAAYVIYFAWLAWRTLRSQPAR